MSTRRSRSRSTGSRSSSRGRDAAFMPAPIARRPAVVTTTGRIRPILRTTAVEAVPPLFDGFPEAQAAAERRRNRDSTAFDKIFNALMSSFSDPISLVLVAIVFAIAIDYTKNPSDNFIFSIADLIGKNSFGDFLRTNAKKAIGIIIVTIGSFASSRRLRPFVVLGLGLVTYILPALEYLSYAFIAAGLRIFFRVNEPAVRFIVLAAVFFIYFINAEVTPKLVSKSAKL